MALEGPKNVDATKNLPVTKSAASEINPGTEASNASIFAQECAWGTIYVKNPNTGEMEMKTTYNGQIVD